MTTNLTRRPSDGATLSNGNPIILRGGHHDLFKFGDNPGRCLVVPGQTLPFVVNYNATPPCQTFPTIQVVQELLWDPEPWTMLFNHLNVMNCNLLRVWLTAGTRVKGTTEPQPLDLNPFKLVNRSGHWKWQVYDAVVNGLWNAEYFRKLAAFAAAAEAHGINLQLSLFNYLDLTTRFDGGDFRAWVISPWNPAVHDDNPVAPGWGPAHLVNPPLNAADEKTREGFFLQPTNGLRVTQEAFTRKVVQTLAGRGNIIFEIMNEPRGTHQQAADFSSKVTGWILSQAGSWRPLISVNASNFYQEPGATVSVFDVDWWRDHSSTYPNYDQVDAISYHGLTGYDPYFETVCNRSNQTVPAADPAKIGQRFNEFGQAHRYKSLVYSTDAVRTPAFVHLYKDAANVQHELHVRDGQIYTNYPNDNSDKPEVQSAKADLGNWAYWCFKPALAHQGKVHFQNHSMNQRAYRRIKEALTAAGG
jgi:hypothetical protein